MLIEEIKHQPEPWCAKSCIIEIPRTPGAQDDWADVLPRAKSNRKAGHPRRQMNPRHGDLAVDMGMTAKTRPALFSCRPSRRPALAHHPYSITRQIAGANSKCRSAICRFWTRIRRQRAGHRLAAGVRFEKRSDMVAMRQHRPKAVWGDEQRLTFDGRGDGVKRKAQRRQGAGKGGRLQGLLRLARLRLCVKIAG